MKIKILLYALCFTLYPILVFTTGTQDKESSIESRDEGARYSVSFYGTLNTQTGHSYDVDSITFNRLIKEIPLYAMPGNDMWEPFSNQDRLKLKVNPATLNKNNKSRLVEMTKKDLVEISTIETPHPTQVWIFNDKLSKNTPDSSYCSRDVSDVWLTDSNSTLYTEIIITNKNGNASHYLVEQSNNIYANAITNNGPEKIVEPIPGLKKLTIKGYKSREDGEDKRKEPVQKNNTKQVYHHRTRSSKKLKTIAIAKNDQRIKPINTEYFTQSNS